MYYQYKDKIQSVLFSNSSDYKTDFFFIGNKEHAEPNERKGLILKNTRYDDCIDLCYFVGLEYITSFISM